MALSKSTLPEVLRPLMECPSVALDHCAICGRPAPLEQHHFVRRGAGKLFDADGNEVEKPTVTLCGFGNNLRDADGRFFCHGLAHANRLHFRNRGGLQALVTEEPVDYMTALEMEGWRSL